MAVGLRSRKVEVRTCGIFGSFPKLGSPNIDPNILQSFLCLEFELCFGSPSSSLKSVCLEQFLVFQFGGDLFMSLGIAA